MTALQYLITGLWVGAAIATVVVTLLWRWRSQRAYIKRELRRIRDGG